MLFDSAVLLASSETVINVIDSARDLKTQLALFHTEAVGAGTRLSACLLWLVSHFM